MSLIDKMTDKDLFTEVELSVLGYIKNNLNKVIHMSIQELAKQTYTSNATIIRICKKLDTNGFKDLKYTLMKELEAGKYITRDVDYNFPFHQNESIAEIIENMSSLHKNTINLINNCLDKRILDAISQHIIKADHVFIFAMGDSKISAMNFVNKLVKSGIYCMMATENNEEIVFSQNLTHKDCAIFISYRGDTPEINKCFQLAKKTGCTIVAITAGQNSMISQYGDYPIIIPRKETEDKIATFYSQIAFGYILNILFSIIYVQKS